MARPVLVRSLLAVVIAGAAALVWLAIGERWALRPWVALGTSLAVVAADALATSARARRLASVAIPAVLLADVASVYIGYHPQVPRAWADPARARALLPDRIFEDPHPRVVFDSSATPNLSALYGVVDIRGYGYPVGLRYDAYMREGLGLANPATLEPVELHRPEVIAGVERTCARWLLTTGEYGAEWAGRVEPVWQHKGRLHLYELPRAAACAAWHPRAEVARVPDLASAVVRLREGLLQEPEPVVVELAGGDAPAAEPPTGGSRATLTRPHMGRLEVELSGPSPSDGWVTVRESHDPGWRATSETGAPLRVVPAQVRFLAVEVPRGTRRVTLEYRPPRWDAAWAIAGISLAALVVSLGYALRGDA